MNEMYLLPTQISCICCCLRRHQPANKPSADTTPVYPIVLLIRMELCAAVEPGTSLGIMTLREWLDDNNLRNPVKAFEIFASLMKGVRHIHRARFVHRDLKPANVFVQLEPKVLVKIGDFGLATTVKGHVQRFVGTPPYMAPEVAAVVNRSSSSSKLKQDVGIAPQYSEAADIYSCGVILLELLHPAFKTAHERFSALGDLCERHEMPASFPGLQNHSQRIAKLQELLLSMTKQEASQRINIEDVWRILPEAQVEWRSLNKRLAKAESRPQRPSVLRIFA